MPSRIFKPPVLSAIGRRRLLKLTLRVRALRNKTKKIESVRAHQKKMDAWAYAFLEQQSLLRPLKNEHVLEYRIRAGFLINGLPEPFLSRAKKMFILQKNKWLAEEAQIQAEEKRLMLKFGLKRVR